MSNEERSTERAPFVDELTRRIARGDVTVHLLHGAVRDLHPHAGRHLTLVELLVETALAGNEVVAHYDLATGVRLLKRRGREETLDGLLLERAPDRALAALERLLAEPGAALIVDQVEALAPAEPRDEADRRALVALRRLALSTEIARRKNPVVLIGEPLEALHPSVARGERVAALAVPLPDEAARRETIRIAAPALVAAIPPGPGGVEGATWLEALAHATAGLGATAIRALLEPRSDPQERERALVRRLRSRAGDVEERARRLAALTPFATVAELEEHFEARAIAGEAAAGGGSERDQHEAIRLLGRRRDRALERALDGRVTVVEPPPELPLVGAESLRRELPLLGRELREGGAARAPSLLLVGPPGAGKRSAAATLARESGLVALLLSPAAWRGASAAAWRELLSVVEALGGAVLIVPHVDRLLAPGGPLPDAIADAIADGALAGSGAPVLALTTRRPDLLERARPGLLAAARVLALGATRDPKQVESVLVAQIKRQRLVAEPGLFADPGRAELCRPLVGLAAGELEAVLARAARLADPGRAGAPIKRAHLAEAARTWLPRERDLAELAELLAAQAAADRTLLGERHAPLSDEQLALRRAELRDRVDGRRARPGSTAR